MLQDITWIAKKCFVHYDPNEKLPVGKKEDDVWVAILVDADGLNVNIEQAFVAASELGEVVVKRLYANYNIPAMFTAWKRLYKEYRFVRRISLGVHKNIADMALVSDAVELAITVPEISCFVLVSHDGGFFPLMHKLAMLGKQVYWIGGEKPLKKAEKLREEIDQKLGEYYKSLISNPK